MKSLATINPNVQQPYEPEELDEGSQKALESLQENIDNKQKELDRLENPMDHPSVRKMPRDKRLSLIKQAEFAIADWNEEIRQMTATGTENLEWEAKALSGKDIEVDPVLAEAARRKERQEKARQRAAEKDLKTEQTTATKTQPVANIVKADSKWGELSNLSKHSFTWNGKEYNSVEHAYQTNKSGKFDRVTYQAYIDKPEALKIVGKFQADKGTNIQLMEDLYRQMLSENPDVAKLLKETEGFKLTHQLRNTDIWTNEMPKILEKLRDEVNNPSQKVKGGTVYNTIENPDGLNHYVNRTQYNYANSDITFDFTTGGPSGAGNSAGKGTPDFMTKWNEIKVDNVGRLNMNNIDEAAQKLADALTSGQTVNIAGHGNYSSTRGGLTGAVPQSQIDKTVQTIFDKAIELAGDKPITGKVISGGQSGFDEGGIRVARNLGIPTEVNVTHYTYRDAQGEHINVEEEFKSRIDSDTKYGPGAADPNDPAFKAVSEVEAKSNTPGFGRYAIYLIDPISELIEDGAIALAGKMGLPKVAQALTYLMYYEAANLVSGILDATPQAANQAALAQMDQSMILGAGIGMVDEEQYASWKEDLNNATVENIEKAMEDAEQMASRSPLSRGWMAFEEATGAKVSPWQWDWVQDIMGSVGNQIAKIGNHEY